MEPVLGGLVISRPKPIRFAGGDRFGFRLLSDLHIGAPQVDYRLIQHEIADAVAKNDRVLINGDVLDAIVAADKKRFRVDCLHPRIANRPDHINAAIDWAVELLAPAAHLIDMIGLGNHETSLEKHSNFDPLSAIVRDLQKCVPKKSTHVIHYGGYTGFVDYRFQYRTPAGEGNGKRLVLYYHHGSGGAAPVTKGMIDFNRKDTWISADIIWMAHKHNRWNASVLRMSCPKDGDQPIMADVRHVMTGAYFKTYCGQSQKSLRQHGRRTNYAADMGLAPQGMGGARVEVRFGNKNDRYSLEVQQ